jgi:uncharacterized lipoprotein YajG
MKYTKYSNLTLGLTIIIIGIALLAGCQKQEDQTPIPSSGQGQIKSK